MNLNSRICYLALTSRKTLLITVGGIALKGQADLIFIIVPVEKKNRNKKIEKRKVL